MARITNETLAALMTEHHAQTTKRLDKIDEKQAIANGRLSKAELAIAVLEDARRSVANDGGVVAIPKRWIAAALAAGGAIGAFVKAVWPS